MKKATATLVMATSLTLAACGGNPGTDGEAGTTPTPARIPPVTEATPPTTAMPTATPTPTVETSALPRLPELEVITDPGTVDRIFGAFPASEPRNVQAAWVAFADKAEEFLTSAMRYEEVAVDQQNENEESPPAVPVLDVADQADVYADGVSICTQVRENHHVQNALDVLAEGYAERATLVYETQVGPRNVQAELGILLGARDTLCPEIAPIVEDFDRLSPTPVMIRSILGVSSSSLSDGAANAFANAVCDEIERGESLSRLATTVADESGYPDETADDLVTSINNLVCA